MARVIWFCLLLALGTPVGAEGRIADLAAALRMTDVVQVLHDEGISYGRDLNVDMLAGQGGEYWDEQLGVIYRPERIEKAVLSALETELTGDQIDDALTYYQSPEGQEIVALETTARIAMGDPEVEEFARTFAADLDAAADPALDPIRRYVDIMDLVDRNVAGAVEDNMLFYRGMVDGGALDLSIGQIEDTVWGDIDLIREDARSWVYGYLLMAYRPIASEQMETYLTFGESEAGQALNIALFQGFAVAYRQISYELGQALAHAMHSQSL